MRKILDKTLVERFVGLLEGKKGQMSPIVGAFILLLVVSIIAGMTFLFTDALKATTAAQTAESFVVTNETLSSVDEKGEFLANVGKGEFVLDVNSVTITNGTAYEEITTANYTATADGIIVYSGSSAALVDFNTTDWNVNYTYSSVENSVAYSAINDTETSGITLVDFLPILFLAIIFGVILTVVLKVILPFINLGNQAGF